MKILTVADTVCEELLERRNGAPPHDQIGIVISCGDLPPEYLTALKALYDVPLLYVLGNHDLRFAEKTPVGCTPIDRKVVTCRGFRFTGFSGSRWYNGNSNQYTEQEMSAFIRGLRFQLWRRRGTDIVVTHAPPRYIHDEEDRCHRGFQIFRKFIEKYEPSWFLHGHIHKLFVSDDQRLSIFHSTRVINCYGYYIFTPQTDGFF